MHFFNRLKKCIELFIINDIPMRKTYVCSQHQTLLTVVDGEEEKVVRYSGGCPCNSKILSEKYPGYQVVRVTEWLDEKHRDFTQRLNQHRDDFIGSFRNLIDSLKNKLQEDYEREFGDQGTQ